MLSIALAAFLITGGLGALLLSAWADGRPGFSRARIAATHGLLGAASLAGFIWILVRAGGAASPATMAALGLLTVALVLGLSTLALPRGQRPPMLLIGLHAALAGLGIVLMAGAILG